MLYIQEEMFNHHAVVGLRVLILSKLCYIQQKMFNHAVVEQRVLGLVHNVESIEFNFSPYID